MRLSHLKAALLDLLVDVIWLLSGGYGITRLMLELVSLEKPLKEKLFKGSVMGLLYIFY
ncbi:MAG: hypothetical protein K0M45_00695 [Candidatus Paracaedibacteraceae bacterium]|nr:hypothetical protein [Candidatus Paracaedibacteraceae bacterium]